MRITDVFLAFPGLILAMAVVAGVRQRSLLVLVIAIAIRWWAPFARIMRAQSMSIMIQEFVQAARAIGAGPGRIMFRHILPNILGPLVVAETLAIPGYISLEAFLSFIGIGVTAPTPSWGSMISDGAGAIRSYPYQAVFPALALAITMFAFNFLGDGLRDAMDPRLRGTQ
jgi:oligopeptide transport system permease protein